uniref:Uncharacterized protein n=1 Tax=Anguilla anguilla TaxID=7936 RepID=A0A0E9U5F0_ANGAN
MLADRDFPSPTPLLVAFYGFSRSLQLHAAHSPTVENIQTSLHHAQETTEIAVAL